MKYTLFISISLVLLFSCATKSPIANRYVSKKKNIEHLIKLGNLNWEKRVDVQSAKLSKHFLAKAVELDQDNPDAVALYSRSCYFNGRFIKHSEPESADSLFTEGFSAAWKFITATREFQSGFQSIEGDSIAKNIAGLESLPNEVLPVAYWWAENFTSYLLTKPVLERLENREIIETVLHQILSIDPE